LRYASESQERGAKKIDEGVLKRAEVEMGGLLQPMEKQGKKEGFMPPLRTLRGREDRVTKKRKGGGQTSLLQGTRVDSRLFRKWKRRRCAALVARKTRWCTGGGFQKKCEGDEKDPLQSLAWGTDF